MGSEPANDLRFTVRHLSVSGGQPNAILLYGIPDDAAQKAQNTYYSGAWNNQATAKWHNEIRYGGLRLRSQFDDFAPTGIPDWVPAIFLARPITINGGERIQRHRAGDLSVRRQLIQTSLQRSPTATLSMRRRTIAFNPHVVALGGFKYEAERGSTQFTGFSGEQHQPRQLQLHAANLRGYSQPSLLQRRQRHRRQWAVWSCRNAACLGRLLSCSALGVWLAERDQTACEFRQRNQRAEYLSAG